MSVSFNAFLRLLYYNQYVLLRPWLILIELWTRGSVLFNSVRFFAISLKLIIQLGILAGHLSLSNWTCFLFLCDLIFTSTQCGKCGGESFIQNIYNIYKYSIYRNNFFLKLLPEKGPSFWFISARIICWDFEKTCPGIAGRISPKKIWQAYAKVYCDVLVLWHIRHLIRPNWHFSLPVTKFTIFTLFYKRVKPLGRLHIQLSNKIFAFQQILHISWNYADVILMNWWENTIMMRKFIWKTILFLNKM